MLSNDEFMAVVRRPEFMSLDKSVSDGEWHIRINRLGRWFSTTEPSQDEAAAWAGRMFAQWDAEDKLYEPACQWLGNLCGDFQMPIERGTYHIGDKEGVLRIATWKETFNGLIKHAMEIGIEEPRELRELAEEV